MPTTACPYCNAAVPVPGPVPADGRVPCPRCGEEVTVRAADGAGAPPAPAGARAAATPGTHPADTRLSNRALARLVVGGMLFLAAATVVYALKTTEWRRANDYPKGEKAPEPPAAVRPLP